MKTDKDTIAAISTPPGEGGIGIVRLSGDKSFRIAEQIFRPAGSASKTLQKKSHVMQYGHIVDPATGTVYDEVLITLMMSPGTYTGEDMVEINCHGGVLPLKKILELCTGGNARLAQPGEFTKRAFLNGKIDLTQAEAVLDIISARSERAMKQAAFQLKGGFSEDIKKIRGSFIKVLSRIELAIDFVDEDVEFEDVNYVKEELALIRQEIETLLETADRGFLVREGINVVICGKPNVGKSSLMNALLGHDRVIVTPLAGTTRDVIEEIINIDGIAVNMIDTAGISVSENLAESEGVKRSKNVIELASLVIFMIDASQDITEEDMGISNYLGGKNKIIALNKVDLPVVFSREKASQRFNDAHDIVEISVATGEGMKDVEESIRSKMFCSVLGKGVAETPSVTRSRHKESLEKVLISIKRAEDGIRSGFNGELIASDLNEAVSELGLITGETIDDEVLDRIFSDFCIGK